LNASFEDTRVLHIFCRFRLSPRDYFFTLRGGLPFQQNASVTLRKKVRFEITSRLLLAFDPRDPPLFLLLFELRHCHKWPSHDSNPLLPPRKAFEEGSPRSLPFPVAPLSPLCKALNPTEPLFSSTKSFSPLTLSGHSLVDFRALSPLAPSFLWAVPHFALCF